MRLHAFQCGGEGTDMAFFSPFHPQVGTKVFIPYLFFLIEHPNGLVLFDCGPHPDLAVDPAARLGGTAETYEILVRPGEDAASQLRAGGWEPRDVGHVVLSHLHYDHAGGIESFPNATFHVQRAERQFADAPPIYQCGDYTPADYAHPVRWNEIDGPVDLFADGRVVLTPTPGHTPGHQSLVVRLAQRTLVLVGDAAPHGRTLVEQALPAVLWNPDAMVASWALLSELERTEGALLIYPHDPDFRDWLVLSPDGCYE